MSSIAPYRHTCAQILSVRAFGYHPNVLVASRACGAVAVFEDVALTRLLVFISACVWCVCSSRAQRVLGDGLLVIRKVENVLTGPNNKPRVPCIIVECGEM